MTGEVSVSTEGFRRFNNAADNNKAFILEVLRARIVDGQSVLEIGSGSGQHVACFAEGMPEVTWQPSDRGDYHEALSSNLATLDLPNVLAPLYLDAASFSVPDRYDAAYCANVFHIMPATLMGSLVNGVAAALVPGGKFFVYGPFKYNGTFTTESNQGFDQWLKNNDPQQGIRDIEALQGLAADTGMTLVDDIAMPANNQFLVFEKDAG